MDAGSGEAFVRSGGGRVGNGAREGAEKSRARDRGCLRPASSPETHRYLHHGECRGAVRVVACASECRGACANVVAARGEFRLEHTARNLERYSRNVRAGREPRRAWVIDPSERRGGEAATTGAPVDRGRPPGRFLPGSRKGVSGGDPTNFDRSGIRVPRLRRHLSRNCRCYGITTPRGSPAGLLPRRSERR